MCQTGRQRKSPQNIFFKIHVTSLDGDHCFVMPICHITFSGFILSKASGLQKKRLEKCLHC